MRSNLTFYWILLPALVLAFSFSLKAQDGEKLFQQNCATCHTAGEKKIIGPGLKGITEKRSMEWLIEWTQNSQEMIESGDEDAKAIYEEFNQQVMPPQPLNDEEVKAVFAYIEEGGGESEAEAEKGEKEEGTSEKEAEAQQIERKAPVSHRITTYFMAGLAIVVLLVVIRVVYYARKTLKVELGVEDPPRKKSNPLATVGRRLRGNRKVVGALATLVILFGLKQGWDAMMAVGVHTNYQPEQPIWFSHKVHAGKNSIDCSYCHSGVNKGKTPEIPSVDRCMKCHEYVKEGTQTGTKEIAKIYAAAGWNPDKREYTGEENPIRWVKVHELPDFAYFNHSQHVEVGGLECAECHGKVEEMDVVKQVNDLTMGWCLDCHQKKEVDMASNEYYKEYHDRIPESLKKQFNEDGKTTVRELGGWECAKCHY